MADMSDGCCAVIAAGKIADLLWLKESCRDCSLILCADGGYEIAVKAGIVPDAVVGDFDSGKRPGEGSVYVYPVRKDDTDTALALCLGAQKGYRKFKIFAAITGDRLDHTAASLTLCHKALREGLSVTLFDENNEVFMLNPGCYRFPKDDRKLSLFALFGQVKGLSEKGVSYPLEGYDLMPWDPLCVSNEITATEAVIHFESGVLTVFRSR